MGKRIPAKRKGAGGRADSPFAESASASRGAVDVVVALLTGSAKDAGELFGVPSTGRRFRGAVGIFQLAGGRIHDAWIVGYPRAMGGHWGRTTAARVAAARPRRGEPNSRAVRSAR
jgi:hypothetical protein